MLGALAAAAATAVAGAMGTDGWKGARAGFSHLFRRLMARKRKEIEHRLDEEAALVASVAEVDRAPLRASIVPDLSQLILQLLRELPEIEGEMRDLVLRLHTSLPLDHASRTQLNQYIAGHDQHNVTGTNQVYNINITHLWTESNHRRKLLSIIAIALILGAAVTVAVLSYSGATEQKGHSWQYSGWISATTRI
ncbi:hypothetical protein [Actinophytocola sp.]|uniref:hypothetical protein n=1 Tax=Actinophytocola sp. TaxID=1872138 RepID=UPI002ED3FB66